MCRDRRYQGCHAQDTPPEKRLAATATAARENRSDECKSEGREGPVVVELRDGGGDGAHCSAVAGREEVSAGADVEDRMKDFNAGMGYIGARREDGSVKEAARR